MEGRAVPETFGYRLTQVESRLERLDERKADAKEVARLADEVRALKRTIGAFTVALFTAAIAFAAWALQLATTQ